MRDLFGMMFKVVELCKLLHVYVFNAVELASLTNSTSRLRTKEMLNDVGSKVRTYSQPISVQHFEALYSINCLKLCKLVGALKHREIVG